jgi:hypothetical protein
MPDHWAAPRSPRFRPGWLLPGWHQKSCIASAEMTFQVEDIPKLRQSKKKRKNIKAHQMWLLR